jgi:hypothetical protein
MVAYCGYSGGEKEESVSYDVEPKEAPTREQRSGVSYFDELAKGLARGTLSRGRALKLVGASLVSILLVPLVPNVAEAAPTCPSSGSGCDASCRHTGGAGAFASS